MPLLATYHGYFSKSETNNFYSHYAYVLLPYHIDTENNAIAVSLKKFNQKLYAPAQEGVPTAFPQGNRISGGKVSHIALLHSFSSYPPCMGMPSSSSNDLFFTSKGKVTCGAVG